MSGISNQLRTNFIRKVEGQLWQTQSFRKIQASTKQARSLTILPELNTEEYQSYLEGVIPSSDAKNNIGIALSESQSLIYDFFEYLSQLMREIDVSDYDLFIPDVIKVALDILVDFFQPIVSYSPEALEQVSKTMEEKYPQFGKRIFDFVRNEILGKKHQPINEKKPELELKIFRAD